MRRRQKPFLLALTLLLLGVTVSGASRGFAQETEPKASGQKTPQAGEKSTPPEDPALPKRTSTIEVISNLVLTPVTVLDGAGQFVYGLSQQDFQIYDNGVPQRMLVFGSEIHTLSVVIVVETNKTAGPLLEQVQPLGPVFSSLLLGAEGQAAVVTYDDRARVVQDFSSDSDLLDKTFKHLAVSGHGARLNDALWRALAILESRPKSGLRVIIVFSDGFDAGSETRRDAIIRRATTAGIGIYGLGFSPGHELLSNPAEPHHVSAQDQNLSRPTPSGLPPTPSTEDEIYGDPVEGLPPLSEGGHIIRSKFAKNSLEVYAGYTGGVFYSHWKERALQNQLQRVASEIHSQYELGYVPNTLGQMGFHRITVKVSGRGLKVRTRAGYFYGGTTP
jgi:VWFA-related protein